MSAPDDALIDAVRRALAEESRLRLAILFGSHARRRARPESDIDVGIVPFDPGLALDDELEIQARLERACRRAVDLVRLDRPDVLLRWEAARYGIPVLVRARQDLARFIARASLDHADLAPLMARAAELFRRRLLEPPRAKEPM